MRILVTGGAGSIGSEVCRRLSADGHAVRALDNNESALHGLRIELPDIDPFLGDIQFDHDVIDAVCDMDAVVHCAAYKHVDLCEANEEACRRVDLDGALRVYHHLDREVRFVFVSTDKAVEPTSIYGVMKRRVEQIIGGSPETVIVRFGNVLGSRGSLLPAVLRYIEADQPFPITDPDMTRFFMTAREAVDLVVEALDSPAPLLVPESPRSARIGPFIRVCLDMVAAPGHPTEIVGPREGERKHEVIETRDGPKVWSNDPDCLMHTLDMVALINDALTKGSPCSTAI